MTNSLLQEAKAKARRIGLTNSQTYTDAHKEINDRLTEHLTNTSSPILIEMLLTYYSLPTNLSSADKAKVIMNNAMAPSWTEIPVPDSYAKDLYLSTRVSPNLWNILVVAFTNVYRTNIFFAPFRDKNMGFIVITRSLDSNMESSYMSDLPKEIAVDIMSRDPRILTDN